MCTILYTIFQFMSHTWPPKLFLHEREGTMLPLMGSLMVTPIQGYTTMSLGNNKLPHVLASSFQPKLMVQEAVFHSQVFPCFDKSPYGLLIKHIFQGILELVWG